METQLAEPWQCILRNWKFGAYFCRVTIPKESVLFHYVNESVGVTSGNLWKQGRHFKSVYMLCPPLDWLQRPGLVANRGKRNIVNEQYNRFWKYDKASHAVVGTKGVLILSGLFSCWSWYQRALLWENLNHHQQTVVICSSLKTSWSPLSLSNLVSQLSSLCSHWKLLHWNWKHSK